MKLLIDFSLFSRNPSFRYLFIGQFVSFCGTMMTSVALPYQIYHETHSTLMVGLLGLAQIVPLVFTALLGGAYADYYNRRFLLMAAESSMALGCLLFAFNAMLPHPHLWAIYAISAYMSIFSGFHTPAMGGLIQQIVERDDLPTLSSLTGFLYSSCMIAGPAMGGLMIAHFGLSLTYLIDMASFVISLFCLLAMKPLKRPTREVEFSPWASLKEGFVYAFRRQDLSGSYLVDLIAMIFGMPTALFPAIAQYMGGIKVLGLLYAAPAVGAMLVSFFSGWIHHIRRYGMAISVASFMWGASMVVFGFSKQLGFALTFLALAGGFDAISALVRSMMWNQTIPNEYRSRLSGIEIIFCLSGPKLGDTEAGLVASAFGITTSIVSGGFLCMIGVVILRFLLPGFWRCRKTVQA